ncbi:hypothetical protein [Aneurinibacillus thermoaerophilus]|jgi:hypothetical protein|nr:hypothetical protein [Aneurinibacillus thermoaerophilus]
MSKEDMLKEFELLISKYQKGMATTEDIERISELEYRLSEFEMLNQ